MNAYKTYLSIDTFTHTYIGTRIHTYIQNRDRYNIDYLHLIDIHINIQTYLYINIFTFHKYIHRSRYFHVYTYIHTYIHINIHTYIHTYIIHHP